MSRNSSIITINSSNSTVTDNNTYEYQLRNTLEISNMEIALVSGFLYNSVYNVVANSYQNNTFAYKYPDGSGGMTTYQIDMPDGNYSIDQLLAYLQAQMVTNGTYLEPTSDEYEPLFFINWNVNAVYYAVTLTIDPVPTTLPTGYALPSGAPPLPAIATTPQLVIPTILQGNRQNQGFSYLIGFSAGSYPSATQSTQYSSNSNTSVQINPQYAFNVCTTLVNQPMLNSVPSMIYPFSFTADYQALQIIEPSKDKFYSCKNGSYSSIEVSIKDQAGNPAILNDSQASFTLELRSYSK